MTTTERLKTKITIAHSPDSDDAFMFYGIACGAIDTGDFIIEQVAKDIETLNQEATEGKYDVSAISFACYPSIADRYLLMPCGASFGLQYGPILLAKTDLQPESIDSITIAIPGYMTTAYLLLRLFAKPTNVIVMPFQDIIPAIVNGEVAAGLIIHEGQLTYGYTGLKKIIDLGLWWHETTGLPLPLGGNVIKRDLGKEKIVDLTRIVTQSITYALNNQNDALKYAKLFAEDMPDDVLDRYVKMYVNELSVDCGRAGKEAVKTLFELAAKKQIIESGFISSFV
jgi:1,4-dihydroxy-6-naphthoate synthase